MTVTCLSDLHGYYPKNLLKGDLLIIAGDITASDNVSEWKEFYGWLKEQRFEKKVYIAGNHDRFLAACHADEDISKSLKSELESEGDGIEYLCDSGTIFQGLKVWGSPWSPYFAGVNSLCTAFMTDDDTLKRKFDLIPSDVDILITHTPPFGILDTITVGGKVKHAGDIHLREALENRIKPMLHAFGHIHEQAGKDLVFKRSGFGVECNTTCVNASVLNEHYESINMTTIVYLPCKIKF